ncbi:spore coat U domain-containing protein [Novosphingobium sp. Gsoil 351]|uniref:Csu type fimbrial protein n=1 Tax=Novosphingobium sp. Gsoil 351 TaxID=2675225 RepID=UPI0012B4B284|nr:spore coat U domain-containing protein [Novosphingobium sp. Gsoil 351]QGN54604.1 fimbrial major subunit CsuA/B family protein [Novosphingobium sp. Gsoil 351]
MDSRHVARFVTLFALSTVGAAWPTAQAATAASATMAVSVEVAPNCTVAAEPLVFGTTDAAQAPSQTASAAIEVSCGAEVPFTVALDDGQFPAGGARRALDPASGRYLAYDIFADPAHTTRWGALGSQSVAAVTSSAGTARLTAYGMIGGDPRITAGRYADQVTVTTNF